MLRINQLARTNADEFDDDHELWLVQCTKNQTIVAASPIGNGVDVIQRAIMEIEAGDRLSPSEARVIEINILDDLMCVDRNHVDD